MQQKAARDYFPGRVFLVLCSIRPVNDRRCVEEYFLRGMETATNEKGDGAM